MADRRTTTYRFGPLERRGLYGGLRAGQVVVTGCGAFVGILTLNTMPSAVGLLLAMLVLAVAAVYCFAPVAGRTMEEWGPIASAYALRRAGGGHRYQSAAPTSGFRRHPGSEEPQGAVDLPPEAGNIELLSVPFEGAHVGVVKDLDAQTYTAVVLVEVPAFSLLSAEEQELRLAGWGGLMNAVGREGSPVSRIQWVERTVPPDGDELAAYFNDTRDRDIPSSERSVQSYIDLIEQASAVSVDHEVFVALQIDLRKPTTARLAKKMGVGSGTPAGACRLLLRELRTLQERLGDADVTVVGMLRPRMLSRVIRLAYDPQARTSLGRLSLVRSDQQDDGVDFSNAWPTASEAHWDHYRHDGVVSATYWIASWPRTDARATFLVPMLMSTSVLRTIAVTMEPVPLSVAVRRVEAARTADEADDDLRRRHGFIPTARRRKQLVATAEREEELSHGFVEMRYAGYVTVTGRDLDELNEACAEVEHAAAQSGLQLRLLCGETDRAFSYTLPFCRGLS